MPQLQPGQMLGPYQITSQIGKGGMATVYKAYQVAMDRYVALKVVAGQFLDDPSFMERFRQEARVIARLEHPHILPVYDFGESDGIPYMVMRFLEAGTLTERLDAGLLTLEETDHIFSQLTDALGYAHEKGVIHRDIKPSNAMLDQRGDVFLTDFGIAKILEGSAGLTATGAITGTPSYMSPEQAQGKKVDPRSDIYSLGVMLFEMLTGRVPFEAETPMAVLFRQIQDPPPPLSTVRPDLPYTLEMVLLKALAKNPDDRYPSMAAFRQGWKAAISDAAAIASSVPAPQVVNPIPVAAVTFPPAQKTVLTPPPVSTVPPPPAGPAKKTFTWKPLMLIGLPLCLLVLCISVGFVFRGRLMSMFQRQRPTQIELNASEPGSIPAGGAGAAQGMTRWVAANSVYSIAFRGEEVLTAGLGGVTIWDGKGSSRQLTTADGLPSGNAALVFVDKDNSLWIGTDVGVLHIDGDKQKVYTTGDGLDTNYVFFVTRSGDQLLAATSPSGNPDGSLMQLTDERWLPVAGFPSKAEPDEKTVSQYLRQIFTDRAGNLWVSTGSGLAMRDASNQWTVFKVKDGLPSDSVFAIFQDHTDKLWVGTDGGGVATYDAEKKVFETQQLNLSQNNIYNVLSILEATDGAFWFAGNNVARYDPVSKVLKPFTAEEGTLPVRSVETARMDDKGTLYFGTTESGLARYADGKFERMQLPDSIHFGQYGRIIPAPDGKLIFVQLFAGGADQFDPTTNTWTKVPANRNIPRGFDAKGQMWSGSWDGVWIFGEGQPTHLAQEQGMPSDSVYQIAFGKDGTAYIGTDAGIAVSDGKSITDVYTVAKDGLVSDLIYTLFVASDGTLWAGSNVGFSHRQADGTWKAYTPETLFGGGSSDYFLGFAEDKEGNIWIATHGDGLYLFPKTGQPKRFLATDTGVGLTSNYLNAVTIGPAGALWIGTEGQGVVRYDRKKTWQAFTIKDGLLSNRVDGIYTAPDGAIWFSTLGGISRFVP